jgi:hypothetical protein
MVVAPPAAVVILIRPVGFAGSIANHALKNSPDDAEAE